MLLYWFLICQIRVILLFVFIPSQIIFKMNKTSRKCLNKWKKINNSGSYKRNKNKKIALQFSEKVVIDQNSEQQKEISSLRDAENIAGDELIFPEYIRNVNLNSSISNQSNESICDWDTVEDDEGRKISELNMERFQSEIVCCAIKTKVNHTQLKGFLDIWNNTVPLPNLPKDPRTLLNTPKMFKISTDGNQQYSGYFC